MNTPPTRLAAALLLTLFAAGSAGCDLAMMDFKEQHTERWSKTYELEPGGRIELRNMNGRIDVQPSDGRTVEIVAEKTARAGSVDLAREALGRIEIQEDASPQSIRIETRIQRSEGLTSRAGNLSVRYSLRVPADADVTLRTTNGGIEVAGTRGRAELTTTNGGIKAREMAGPIEARTTNGGLDIDLTAIAEGGVRLSCTNGGINVRVPGDARASIDASVTNGGIDTGSLRIDASETSRRRLQGQLNGGGPHINLRGTNGGIRLSAR